MIFSAKAKKDLNTFFDPVTIAVSLERKKRS